MAVKLRLARLGRKKRPFYRIVAIDSRKARNADFLERIGTYDPLQQPARIEVDHDLAIKWLGNGAKPSDTVRTLLSRTGVMLRWDLSKRKATPEQIEEAVSAHQQGYLDKISKAESAKREAAEKVRRAEEEKAAAEAAEAEAKARAEAEAEAKAKAEAEAAAKAEESEEAPAEEAASEDAPAEGEEKSE